MPNPNLGRRRSFGYRVARRLRRVLIGSSAKTPAKAAGTAPGAKTVALPVAPPLPPRAEIYAGVAASSLDLAGLRTGSVPAVVSLVLPPVKPDKIFAGVATALEFAARLALSMERPLRIVPLDNVDAAELAAAATAHLKRQNDAVPQITVLPRLLVPHVTVSPDDVWIVTYWTTAHAADVAVRLGVLDPRKVIYLIQDYEPGFHAWSVPFALTRATYHAGFHHVVNSRPLAEYLARHEGPETDHGLVIAPHLDLDQLARVAALRRPDPKVRVFFYGRPSKPRNLYPLGVAALRAAGARLDRQGIGWQVVSAGEPHPAIPLAGAAQVTGLGTLSWDGYYDLLSRVDIGLTLMLSPHPSHPPLEVAVSGGLAVTNDLDGARTGYHDRIITAAADPDLLAGALVDAVHRVLADGPGTFSPPPTGVLGDPLDAVVARLLTRLDAD